MHEGLLRGINLEENSHTYIYIYTWSSLQASIHTQKWTYILCSLPPPTPSLHTHFIQTYTHKHYIVLSMSSLF